MPLPKTIIHLLSGGMDSTVLLYDLIGQGHHVHALLFHYEQQHQKELDFAKRHCERLKVMFTVMCIPQLRGSTLTDGAGGVVVPNRNAIMLSHAVNLAVAAHADTITIGCNKDDEEVFPDCRREFLDAMNAVVKVAGYDIEICAPYLDKQKWYVARLGSDIGVTLSDTWSCYNGGEKPCGVCPACVKRLNALSVESYDRGLDEPVAAT